MFKSDHQPGADTVIGHSVHVEGDLSSQGNIHVAGAVTGTIDTAANLTVGEEARIAANVRAVNVFVAGQLKGNLTVQERLELAPTSKVEGDVTAKVLVVAEGAELNGRCQMSSQGAPVHTPGRNSKKNSAAAATEPTA